MIPANLKREIVVAHGCVYTERGHLRHGGGGGEREGGEGGKDLEVGWRFHGVMATPAAIESAFGPLFHCQHTGGERIVAFEEPCTRLTAAPSKEEENRSFLSHPFPDTHGHLITVKR